MKILVNIAYFFCLLPYISPYAIETDLQPLFLFAMLACLFFLILKNSLYFNTVSFLIFIISIISLLYIDLSSEYSLITQMGLLVGFFSYIFNLNFLNYLHKNTIYLVLSLLFFGLFYQYINPISFGEFINYFMQNNRYNYSSFRGYTSLTPEPAFLSALSFLCAYLTYYLYTHHRLSRNECIIVLYLSITLMLFSQSVTSLPLIIISLFVIVSISKLHLFPILVLSILFLFFFNSSRFLALFSYNFYDLLVVDQSISQRLSNLNTAFYALQNNQLGYGAGSFQRVSLLAHNSASFDFHHDVRPEMIVSSFARLSVELSFIFILFFSFIYGLSFKHSKFIFIFVSIFFIFFSFPFSFPGIWFLLFLRTK